MGRIRGDFRQAWVPGLHDGYRHEKVRQILGPGRNGSSIETSMILGPGMWIFERGSGVFRFLRHTTFERSNGKWINPFVVIDGQLMIGACQLIDNEFNIYIQGPERWNVVDNHDLTNSK